MLSKITCSSNYNYSTVIMTGSEVDKQEKRSKREVLWSMFVLCTFWYTKEFIGIRV